MLFPDLGHLVDFAATQFNAQDASLEAQDALTGRLQSDLESALDGSCQRC